MADVTVLEPTLDTAEPEPDDELVHFACPKAFGDRVVTAYCGYTQEFPYTVWNDSPPERHCAMCVHESQQPGSCPKFGVCQGCVNWVDG